MDADRAVDVPAEVDAAVKETRLLAGPDPRAARDFLVIISTRLQRDPDVVLASRGGDQGF